MRCERMHATISIATCVANQGNRMSPGMFRRSTNDLRYAGCKDCPTGAQAARGELNDDDLKAVLERLQNRFNPPVETLPGPVSSVKRASKEKRTAEYPTRNVQPQKVGGAMPTSGEKQQGPDSTSTKEEVMQEEKEVTKKCCRCGKVKALDRFGANKKSKDGHHAHCLECNRAKQNLYAKQDRERKHAERAELERLRKLVAEGGSERQLAPAQPIIQEAVATGNPNLLTLDFSRYPEVLEEIKRRAEDEERPPEVQARYLLRKHLYPFGRTDKKLTPPPLIMVDFGRGQDGMVVPLKAFDTKGNQLNPHAPLEDVSKDPISEAVG